MITLYEYKSSRSIRCQWTLRELGIDYKKVEVDVLHKPDWFLALNPMGKVPVLVDDDVTMIESAAICMYLADQYPDKGLAPLINTPARARYYQWISYAINEIDPLLWILRLHRDVLPEKDRVPGIIDITKREVVKRLDFLQQNLGDKAYFVGDKFTVVDILMTQLISWASVYGLLEGYQPLVDYKDRHRSRPGFPAHLYQQSKQSAAGKN